MKVEFILDALSGCGKHTARENISKTRSSMMNANSYTLEIKRETQ